jgi:hypothetical protein
MRRPEFLEGFDDFRDEDFRDFEDVSEEGFRIVDDVSEEGFRIVGDVSEEGFIIFEEVADVDGLVETDAVFILFVILVTVESSSWKKVTTFAFLRLAWLGPLRLGHLLTKCFSV